MLRLPPNLLVMDHAGIDAYRARAARPGDDGFDFRGVQWLGRDRDISTAVSARAFRDVRQAPPSRARAEYLGFGQNEPARGYYLPGGGTRGGAAAGAGCTWSLAAWSRPISAEELVAAGRAASGGAAGQAEIVTGAAFTDTAITGRGDLDNYRILHFATHGLVTPPRPECPARPALLTSFGGEGSDGLLSFSRDLRSQARCRPHHPFRLRHRGPGERGGDRGSGPHRRRRVRARRAGARLRRRRRADGDRQPLAGARRFQRHRAADLRPVHGAAGDGNGARAAERPARADGRCGDLASLLLVGLRGGRRRRRAGDRRRRAH